MPGAIGLGTTLHVDDGAANAFQVVPDLLSIDPPADEVGMVESKRLDISGGLMGKVVGIKDGGTFSFTYEFTQAAYARMEALKGASKNFKITPNGGTARTTPGFVTQNKQDAIEADGIMSATVTVCVNGPTS